MKRSRSVSNGQNYLRVILLASFVLFAAFAVTFVGERMTPSSQARASVRAADGPGFLILVNDAGDGSNTAALPNCDADPDTPGDQCTFRAALEVADQSPGSDGIRFQIINGLPRCRPFNHDIKCFIAISSALPTITEGVDIAGPGPDRVEIFRPQNSPDTLEKFRILTIDTTDAVAISGLELAGGDSGDSSGGGIGNDSDLTITNCLITANKSHNGGGIFTTGKLTVIDSTVSNNDGELGAGGIYSQTEGGILNVDRSTIFNNRGQFGGIGLIGVNGVATFELSDSTVTENSGSFIGGVFGGAPESVIKNSTITGNTATSSGARDSVGGVASRADLSSSIVALNTVTPAPDNDETPNLALATSAGFNVIGSLENSNFVPGPTDQTNVTAEQLNLGPLQDNGGPTFTHALGAGSIAIDAGISNALTSDQRGAPVPRTFDDPNTPNASGSDGTDVGAFEVLPDSDGDGIIDLLDPDDDNDGIADTADNCHFTANTDQADSDGDGMGDACDLDDDNDGVADTADNCRVTPNADQADFDLDGIGDACDLHTGPPVDKNQCKNGGWARFDTPTAFASENDCKKFLKGK